MNDPLKHKLFTIYGQILHKKVLMDAWKSVKANKGCAGIDKMSIKKFSEHEDEYIDELLIELKNKTYKPSPVKRVYIKKKNGKLRPLGIPTIKDRIVQQAIVMRVQGFFEKNVFHQNSCGFRPDMGTQDAIYKVANRLNEGFRYIYDFDIKGFFDNIPHKKLMKVLNKYIADGTVLDIIWKSLKAGYMEDRIKYETSKGTVQGGVISPLCANIYLNELDWELHKAEIESVRYADDSLALCRTKEDLERAIQVVHRVLDELGLELSEEKTYVIDFDKDDFDYLGFTFGHWRLNKDGERYFTYSPSKSSIKKFKSDIKAKTCKTFSHSFEEWVSILNPILRGKFNYLLIPHKILRDCRVFAAKAGKVFRGKAIFRPNSLDGYVRGRLRVNFANRGKKSAKIKDGFMLHVKYGIDFFVSTIGLFTGGLELYSWCHKDTTPEEYVSILRERRSKSKSNSQLTPEQWAKRREFWNYAFSK